MSNTRTDYEILGIDKNASEIKIKQAFRAKMLACHPDKHPEKNSEAQEVIGAYSRLIGKDITPNSTPSTNNSSTAAAPHAYDKTRWTKNGLGNFNFDTFRQHLWQITMSQAPSSEVETYFKNNINGLQYCLAEYANGYLIRDIVQYLRYEHYELINLLDPELLRERFKDRSFENLLNILPVEFWPDLFDHLGRSWSIHRFLYVSNMGSDAWGLSSVMGYMTGASELFKNSNAYISRQYATIFSYIGEKHLREVFSNPNMMGVFLSAGDHYGSHQALLNFLNNPALALMPTNAASNENLANVSSSSSMFAEYKTESSAPLSVSTSLIHLESDIAVGNPAWLKDTYDEATSIGIILDNLAKYVEHYRGMFDSSPQPEPTLQNDALSKWKMFLVNLGPDWRKNIVADNPESLGQLLAQLDTSYDFDNKYKVKKIQLFLEHYVHPNQLSTFGHLVSLLRGTFVTNNDNRKDILTTQSLKLITAFSDEQLTKMLLDGKDLKRQMTALDKHKEEPFYKALLFAAAKAYLYEKKNTIEQEQKTGGFFYAVKKKLTHSNADKIVAAAALIKYIRGDKEKYYKDIVLPPAAKQGVLGDITKRYEALLAVRQRSGAHLALPATATSSSVLRR
jgi:hypothetical protein